MPLPQGQWRVIARADEELTLRAPGGTARMGGMVAALVQDHVVVALVAARANLKPVPKGFGLTEDCQRSDFYVAQNDTPPGSFIGSCFFVGHALQDMGPGSARTWIEAIATIHDQKWKLPVTWLVAGYRIADDQDLLGLARQGSEACVQVFFVRRGRLLGRESFFLDRLAGLGEGEILSGFVRQFYAKAVQPPREVLLSAELPDAELVAEWLTRARGSRVELAVPQRGRKRELVAMAEENAALALSTHLLARGNRRQVVSEELRRALALPGPPHRIEGFDISNLQGAEAVGSMVVWEAGT